MRLQDITFTLLGGSMSWCTAKSGGLLRDCQMTYERKGCASNAPSVSTIPAANPLFGALREVSHHSARGASLRFTFEEKAVVLT